MVALLLDQAEEEQHPRGGLPCASKMQLGKQTSKAPPRCRVTATRKVNSLWVPDIVSSVLCKHAEICASKALLIHAGLCNPVEFILFECHARFNSCGRVL